METISDSELEKHLCGIEDACVSCDAIRRTVNSHEALVSAVESLLSIASGSLADSVAAQDLYRIEDQIIKKANDLLDRLAKAEKGA